MDRSNELLEAPMVQWAKLLDKMSPEDCAETESAMTHLAVRAVRAASYVAEFRNGAAHDKRVKRQNAVATKVRKALGYTYGRDDIAF